MRPYLSAGIAGRAQNVTKTMSALLIEWRARHRLSGAVARATLQAMDG